MASSSAYARTGLIFFVPYTKPYKTVVQQLAILKKRHLIINDDQRAIRWLEKTGYYRLSGYWHILKNFASTNDEFVVGANFDLVTDLYVYDKKLRLLVLDALERIEIAIRVDIALLVGQITPYSYRDPKHLDGNFSQKIIPYTSQTRHDRWLDKLDANLKHSTEDFIVGFKQAFPKDKPPIWIAIELWDFGMLSTFYEGMLYKDKITIASKYSIVDPLVFVSWMKSLNYIRNICAHHARLWNKAIVIQPKLPAKGSNPELDHLSNSKRLYDILVILQFLLKKLNPTSSWSDRLKELTDTFPSSTMVSLRFSGFPTNWKSEKIWN